MRKTGYGPSVMESSMTQAISTMKVNTTSPTGCPFPNCQNGAKHEREIRTKPRQTTPLQHIPECPVITPDAHPFEAPLLHIIRRQLRAGRPLLVLLLPDQSRGLIPVDWTDYTDAVSARTVPPIGALGSLADLFHARCSLTLYCAKRNRRLMMQLNLAFAELPNEDSLWEQLDESAREVVIDKLAHAIAKVVAESDPNPREGRYESYLPQDRRQPFATCRVRLHPPVQC